MDGWVESAGRLPETGDQNYLVVVTGKFGNVTFQNAIEIAEYSKSDGWIFEAWPMAKDLKVSHWMPLPDPPLPRWQDAMLHTFLGGR